MRRYQITDFLIFGLLLCLSEALAAWARIFFPGEIYSLSSTLFVTLLMTVRWGAAGTLFAAPGGAAYAFLHGATAAQYAIYIFGNLLFAINLLWLKPFGYKRLRVSAVWIFLYCAGGYLSMCLGRSLVSLALGKGFWLAGFLAADALNAVITVVLLLIARKQNGLFEPQREYILRLKREEEERKHDA